MEQKIKEEKKVKEGRKIMKEMGKWAVLLILMAILVGCSGGGGGGGGGGLSSSSSDEPPIPATDNPIRGTWKVTVNPRGEDITIEPVTLGATGYPVGIVTDEAHVIPATTVEVPLGHPRMVSGSGEVYSAASQGGTKYALNTAYIMNLHTEKTPVPSAIVRKAVACGAEAPECIPDDATVYVSYKYFKCTDCDAMDIGFTVTDANVSYDSLVTTADITIQNIGNYTIEEIRSLTGQIAGAGAANNPTLSNSDYPLSEGDTPDATPANDLVDGWVSGICYATHGNWADFSAPAVQGCSTSVHPKDGQAYMTQWLDPVCGKITNTWTFSGSQEQYGFYMQLTGDAYPWIPDWTAAGDRDSRWTQEGAGTSGNSKWFTTYYASLAYLEPNQAYLDAPGGECNFDNGNDLTKSFNYGYLGTVSLNTGETRRCGTLITDPHLAPGTFFALNVGLEYADWIETYNKDFWDEYIAIAPASRKPQTPLTKGAPYINFYDFQLVWDPVVLNTFSTGDNWTPAGTYFPGSFVRPSSAAVISNQVSLPQKHASNKFEISQSVNAAGFMYSIQNIKMGADGAFSFFKTTSPYRTYLEVTESNYCGVSAADNPILGLPRFGGQWGVAHYEGVGAACQMITEGADAEMDFWFGMMIFQVNGGAQPEDWAYIRFDQTGDNFLDVNWNKKSPDNMLTTETGSTVTESNKNPSAKGSGTEDNSGSTLANIQSDNNVGYSVGATKRAWMDTWSSTLPVDGVVDGATLTVEYWDNACNYSSTECIKYSPDEGITQYTSTLCPPNSNNPVQLNKVPAVKDGSDNTGDTLSDIQTNDNIDYVANFGATSRAWMDSWNSNVPDAAIIDGATLTVEYWEDNGGADCLYTTGNQVQYSHDEWVTTYNAFQPSDRGHVRFTTSVALTNMVGKTGLQMNAMDMRFTNGDADCPIKFDYWFLSVQYHTATTTSVALPGMVGKTGAEMNSMDMMFTNSDADCAKGFDYWFATISYHTAAYNWSDLYSGTPPCPSTGCFCWRTGSTDPENCPATMDATDWVIYNRKEVGNPYLSPGLRNNPPAWTNGCPNAPTGNPTQGQICGGRQMVVGVVCVQ